ncbi:alkaline phosphatase D family protein [Winogradskyella sp. SM1960]|uniref:alkaline phosphatase D family protein n=1 Tax=Winogradskyella sp. SM1960 TaxID=2865955 RepID=UPI001CD65F44|nr:alkaline phosphatase D family protein [Winogradskyella sp. SM1960]
MNYSKFLICCFIASLSFGCKPTETVAVEKNADSENTVFSDYTIAFGSCDNQKLENKLWEPILEHNPDVWIWGGDNVYADTDNMDLLRKNYRTQSQTEGYVTLKASAKIFGTWDDHDYGLNDGGEEFSAKSESQIEMLDFLEVDENDIRRKRAGVYHAELINLPKGTLNIIVLDTRYFRSGLTEAKGSKKRYQPNTYGEGTVLGTAQWDWLGKELTTSKADFNIIVSSIQFLSSEHGFETWGNFPHEVDKLKSLIVESNAKGVILLSGDRHISEFSKIEIDGLDYPLIDFTSSGLTHAYRGFSGEPNPYRVEKVVSVESFGLLKFDFDSKTVSMEMRGENNVLQQKILQKY